MSREWKPGDVAMVEDPAYGQRAMVRRDGPFDTSCWHALDDDRCLDARQAGNARPLVVIDPDSPKDQRRLLSLLRNSGAFRGVVAEGIALDCIGDALREFANPTLPKPDEPTGLGAVVEDSNGDKWVRLAPSIADFDWLHADDPSRSRAWRNIAAVKVLSEGVTG